MNLAEEFSSIISIEAKAVKASVANQDAAEVEEVIKTLLRFDGLVKVIGVGKSAIIGQKIAATLTSTGSPAISMHAADAVHGDMGLLSNEDIVILISYSGESDEILQLIPHLENRKVITIAIVGNMQSRLAVAANLKLNASIDKEACPLNLAPTASTSVTLALGDAIAMTLMKARGITAENFAFNHPAGRLGKRLLLTVADLMHDEGNYPTCSSETDIKTIISLLTEKALGGVCVLGKNNELFGLITDGDIRRAILQEGFLSLRAEDLMTVNPISIKKTDLAYDALKLMEERKNQLSVLPVVENIKSIGLLRLHDLVQSGL